MSGCLSLTFLPVFLVLSGVQLEVSWLFLSFLSGELWEQRPVQVSLELSGVGKLIVCCSYGRCGSCHMLRMLTCICKSRIRWAFCSKDSTWRSTCRVRRSLRVRWPLERLLGSRFLQTVTGLRECGCRWWRSPSACWRLRNFLSLNHTCMFRLMLT